MSKETVELSEKLTVKLKTAGVDKLQDLAKAEVRARLVFDEAEAIELIMALETVGVTTWVLAVKVETPPAPSFVMVPAHLKSLEILRQSAESVFRLAVLVEELFQRGGEKNGKS